MLLRLLIAWAGNVAALWVAATVVHGVSYDGGAGTAVLAGAVFGVLNAAVAPVVKVLAIPLIILTLGLALFGVNMLMLAATGWLVDDFHVDGFWPAAGGALVVWIVNLVLHPLLRGRDR